MCIATRLHWPPLPRRGGVRTCGAAAGSCSGQPRRLSSLAPRRRGPHPGHQAPPQWQRASTPRARATPNPKLAEGQRAPGGPTDDGIECRLLPGGDLARRGGPRLLPRGDLARGHQVGSGLFLGQSPGP